MFCGLFSPVRKDEERYGTREVIKRSAKILILPGNGKIIGQMEMHAKYYLNSAKIHNWISEKAVF